MQPCSRPFLTHLDKEGSPSSTHRSQSSQSCGNANGHPYEIKKACRNSLHFFNCNSIVFSDDWDAMSRCLVVRVLILYHVVVHSWGFVPSPSPCRIETTLQMSGLFGEATNQDRRSGPSVVSPHHEENDADSTRAWNLRELCF